MSRLLPLVSIACCVVLSACATTSVTPVAQNQFLLSTSGAPACGTSGTARVAAKMAAVETLRRGYPRFLILGANSESNVGVFTTGPSSATTTSAFNRYGNSVYGSSTTTFGGNTPIFYGTNDAQLNVLMVKPGERGFSNAIDAQQELGPDWETIVAEGINTCT
ncbi:MAG: hypothetical protein AAFP13_07135 [Pseudomonadota bacterium]